jgi:hypothetical protein
MRHAVIGHPEETLRWLVGSGGNNSEREWRLKAFPKRK